MIRWRIECEWKTVRGVGKLPVALPASVLRLISLVLRVLRKDADLTGVLCSLEGRDNPVL